MLQVAYDTVAHQFVAKGHHSPIDFMIALLEQWDSDYFSPDFHSHIRYSYMTEYSGVLEECNDWADNAEPYTIISGDVVNLGPAVCPKCDSLMALVDRVQHFSTISESWRCQRCGHKMSHSGRTGRRK
jgi:hypothetical protein